MVNQYKHILIAVDTTDEDQRIIERALLVAACNESKVSLVHVVEPTTFAMGAGIEGSLGFYELQQIDKENREHTLKLFSDYEKKYSILEENQYVLSGKPAKQIEQLAEKIEADLIILGSHGQHGLGLLLGSTANDLLHGSKRDLLTVRLFKEE